MIETVGSIVDLHQSTGFNNESPPKLFTQRITQMRMSNCFKKAQFESSRCSFTSKISLKCQSFRKLVNLKLSYFRSYNTNPDFCTRFFAPSSDIVEHLRNKKQWEEFTKNKLCLSVNKFWKIIAIIGNFTFSIIPHTIIHFFFS